MASDGDIDELIQRLRERVDSRRASGQYPPALEADLDRHYREVVAKGVHDPLRRLHTAVAEAERTAEMQAEAIPVDSDLPGGQFLHRTISRLIGRQIEGVLRQTSEHARAVVEVQRAQLFAISDLASRLEALHARMTTGADLPSGAEANALDLDARVQQLEQTVAAQLASGWVAAEHLEVPFDLVSRVVDHVAAADTVAVCSEGTDVERELSERGKEVTTIPAELVLQRLESFAPRSLDAVAVVHAIEFLPPSGQIELVALLADRLREGARVAVLALDPQASARTAAPLAMVHPAYLTFLFREAGFSDVDVVWATPDGPVDDGGRDGAGGVAEAVRRLQERLFGAGHYALTATR